MKILLLRQDRLGDLLISTGLIRNLRELLPNVEIHILLGKRNYFAKHIIEKYIDKFYSYDKTLLSTLKLIFKLKSEKYDYVIDLFDNPSRTSELLIKIINAPNNMGFEKENDRIYNHKVKLLPKNDYHIVDRLEQILFGIKSNIYFKLQNNINAKFDMSLEYNFKQNFNEEYDVSEFIKPNKINLLINLFGSNESKFWGIENNVKLINFIIQDQKYNLLISTTKDRENYLNEIKSNLNLKIDSSNKSNITFLPFNKDLDFIAKVISNCNMVFTPDTAIVHIAACFKVPTVILYPDDEIKYGGKYWTPYNTKYHYLTSKTGKIPDIKVEEVIFALDNLSQS